MRDYNRLIRRYKNKVIEDIPNPNKQLILDFAEQCDAEPLSDARTLEYLRCIYNLTLILNKPFREAKKQDIVRVVNVIKNKSTKYRGYSAGKPRLINEGYSESTILGYKISLKKFYKWLNGDEEYPDCVKWMKCTKPPGKVQKEDILTEEEITRIINSARTLRDRCFIHLTVETGARAGEIRLLRRKDIEFVTEGALITLVTEKGRGSRKKEKRQVPVVYCVPSLIEYMNNMKDKGPEAYLWVGYGTKNTGNLVDLSTLSGILKRATKRAGIKKRVYLHLLRFSRATHISPHLTESVMRNIFGWSHNSSMPSHYAKLSDGQAQESLFRNVYGIENNGNGEKDVFCSRCKAKVQNGTDQCWRCGLILNEKLKAEKEIEKKELMELRDFKRNFDSMVEDKLNEILRNKSEMMQP